MLDTSFTFGEGPHLWYDNNSYTVVECGILNDVAYAEVTPENLTVREAVLANLGQSVSPSIQEIQMELDKLGKT